MGNSTTQANHDKVIISRKGIGFIIEKLICAEPDTQAEPAFCGRLTLFVRPLMSKITIAKEGLHKSLGSELHPCVR